MSFNNNSLRFPPGFGHGRGHGQSGQAPELGGGIYAGWGSGQGRETIGGFPVGQGLQGPGGLIAGGLEGGVVIRMHLCESIWGVEGEN